MDAPGAAIERPMAMMQLIQFVADTPIAMVYPLRERRETISNAPRVGTPLCVDCVEKWRLGAERDCVNCRIHVGGSCRANDRSGSDSAFTSVTQTRLLHPREETFHECARETKHDPLDAREPDDLRLEQRHDLNPGAPRLMFHLAPQHDDERMRLGSIASGRFSNSEPQSLPGARLAFA